MPESQDDRFKLLNKVPPPAVVREKLSDAMRDVRLLRHLLKVSEKVDRECRSGSRQEVARAS